MIVADSVALSYSINATSGTLDVAPSIAPAVNPLPSLGLISVIALRCRIRVTFFIGDYKARVSSSSEECFTSYNTFKVEAS